MTTMTTLVPTNHLTAQAEEAWIALVMGECFHNSNRGDLPTRSLRVYFAPFDSYKLRKEENVQGHMANLTGFDGPRSDEPLGWNRFSNAYCTGYQMRDLQSFIWRAEHKNHRFEIRAQRISETRWNVEYRSEGGEYSELIKDWFQMIDPMTFNIVKATNISSLASAAGAAAQIVNHRTTRGYHPQMFEALKTYASKQNVDVSNCWGISSRAPDRAEVALWWKMMLELPPEEDKPTFREDWGKPLHQWKLRHADIMFEQLKELLPDYFRGGSCTATEKQIIEELVIIGQAVHNRLGHPPKFSFGGYLGSVNWQKPDGKPAPIDKTRRQRIFDKVSEQLGWTMS